MTFDGAAPDASGLERVVCNPFYVLGLTPAARASDLSMRFASLRDRCDTTAEVTFTTPLGPQPLTLNTLRWAAAELRDRDRRLIHEMRYVPLEPSNVRLAVVPGGSR